jgi:hypothetical protein
MYHPVSKVGGENLAFNRIIDDETDATTDTVSAIADLGGQLEEFMLEIHLKSQLIDRIPLVLSRIVVGAKKV